ncbi:MAG: DUF2520 domain-containing protein [Dysgonamonadaceae bacterium]|jgi:predicted short-subunit dehydrogenase-like oxidoreductase (DUF2520 family)|nr:DUF2520 domain-containing protein [Dysgonamonadaceae bacterium]
MNIALIGAGNVATSLGMALQEAGFSIVQVYSRTEKAASLLSYRLHTSYTTDIRSIRSDVDVSVFSVKDDAIPLILQQIPFGKGLYVHTAGSVPATVFQPYAKRYGVFYPLQTFTKGREQSFKHIPILYEASSREDETLLQEIAAKLSDTTLPAGSDKRKYIHLSATFACNFTNHLYALAAEVLEEQQIPYQLLLPLIEETAAKIRSFHPKDSQTGPAIRRDMETVQQHLQLLTDKNKREIYDVLTQSILASNA